jgi:hypothetical protein
MLGAIAIDAGEEFIRDTAELPAQRIRHHGGVELGALAHDRLNGVDMMLDQVRRHLIEVGRVLDDAAEAFGRRDRGGKAERHGVALDVMGGAKQLFAPQHVLPKPSKVARVNHHAAVPYGELPALMAQLKAREGVGVKALQFLTKPAKPPPMAGRKQEVRQLRE